jgi:flagellar biosynthesis/type III secretory pathway protein FliH
MIPLAQYLTEYEEQDGVPFGSRRSRAPRPRRQRQPDFEHLMRVANHAFDPDPTSEVVPFPLAALPEMELPATAWEVAEAPEAEDLPFAAPAFEAADLDDAPFLIEAADEEEESDELEERQEEEEEEAQEAAPSQDELLEAAREEGRAEARAAAEAEHEAALAEAVREERERAEAAHAAALDAARAEWAAAEGERLAGLFDERLDRIEAVVQTSLSSVLRPIALGARRRQTVMELAGAVRTLTLDGKAMNVRASGPADLLEALAAQLGNGSAMVAFTPDEDSVEVRIECDQTVIESRLAGWRKALEEALA